MTDIPNIRRPLTCLAHCGFNLELIRNLIPTPIACPCGRKIEWNLFRGIPITPDNIDPTLTQTTLEAIPVQDSGT